MHLVLVETAGNQRYIFSTRRRRENVGASELVRRAGTDWVLDALREQSGANLDSESILDQDKNGPIERTEKPEVIYLASGKALLAVPGREVGAAVVRAITERALREAPGLQVTGVVSPELPAVDEMSARQLADAVRALHSEIHALRAHRTNPVERSPRLPIVAPCAYGGWAAEQLARDDTGDLRPVSREVATKAGSDLVHAAYRRMGWERAASRADGQDEDETSWAAIFHADGNGFGRLFMRFEEHIDNPDDSARRYLDKLRLFSSAIDHVTKAAFKDSVRHFGGPEDAAALPLVLAGDDVTLFCQRGEHAMAIATEYLRTFERHANAAETHNGILREVAKNALGGRKLTASGGVVLVKQHFPFSAAYSLAEQLCAEAKRACRARNLDGISMLSLHILFDSSATALDDIRRRLEPSGVRLYGSPYVVSNEESDDRWLAAHSIGRLDGAVRAVLRTRDHDDGSDGGRLLPTSQLNAWAEAARLGKKHCDAAYKLASHRYDHDALAQLEGDAGSLFWEEDEIRSDCTRAGTTRWVTRLLDALALARVAPMVTAADMADETEREA